MGLMIKGIEVEIRRASYDNGRVALILITPNGGKYCTITTNAYDHPCPSGHAHVKNWSENDGMLDWLIANGFAEDTGKRDPCGYTSAPLVKLKLDGVKNY